MKTTTIIKKLQEDQNQDAILIGTTEEREAYFPAITSIRNGIVTYDYDRLVECFATQFLGDKNYHKLTKNADYNEDDAYTDAVEWIEYNVIRALPYYGCNAPKIKRCRY